MWSGCDDGMTRGSDPGRRIEKIVFQILPELGPGGRCTNRFMCGWREKVLGSAVYERLAMSQWVQGLMQVQPNCGAGRMEVCAKGLSGSVFSRPTHLYVLLTAMAEQWPAVGLRLTGCSWQRLSGTRERVFVGLSSGAEQFLVQKDEHRTSNDGQSTTRYDEGSWAIDGNGYHNVNTAVGGFSRHVVEMQKVIGRLLR